MNRLPPISTLMSPPENTPADSFNSNLSISNTPATSTQSSFNADQQTLPSIAEACGPMPDLTMQNHKMSPTKILPSPPVSPWVGNNKKQDVEVGSPTTKNAVLNDSTKDPVLYPSSESGTEHTHDPLFPPEQVQLSQEDQMITSHIDAHMQQFQDKVNKPTFEEYRLALSCVPVVSREYNRNPGAWLKKEWSYLDEQFRAVRRYKELTAPRSFKALAPAPHRHNQSPNKVVKPRSRVQRVPAPRVSRQTPIRTPKATPKHTIFDSFDSPFYTPTKPRNTGERNDDNNYEAIEDFCPPVASLGGNTKGLKAEWKGAGLPLDDDPDRHLLLPAEIQMASALRLTCAQYLTTKRRIFKAKVELLQQGVEAFKKTHAQKAGHIDVNKASRLWTAYDRVGWFDTAHFLKFLQ
jgi:hypothetical protein